MKPLDYARIHDLIGSLNLTQNGIQCKSLDRFEHFNHANERYELTEEEEIKLYELLALIPVFYEKKYTSVRSGCNSYVTKHDLEKYMKIPYVSNATTILAFAYLGFDISQYHDPSPNVSIKAVCRYKNMRNQHQLIQYIRQLKGASIQ